MWPVLPCLLGFVFGWVLWDRWLALAATIAVWGFYFWPRAAVLAFGWGSAERSTGFWLRFALLFVASILLAELGDRLGDRYRRYIRRRFSKHFANPS